MLMKAVVGDIVCVGPQNTCGLLVSPQSFRPMKGTCAFSFESAPFLFARHEDVGSLIVLQLRSEELSAIKSGLDIMAMPISHDLKCLALQEALVIVNAIRHNLSNKGARPSALGDSFVSSAVSWLQKNASQENRDEGERRGETS